MTFLKTFLKGKVSYLSALSLVVLAAVDFANDQHGAALEKLTAALAVFGLRRAQESNKNA